MVELIPLERKHYAALAAIQQQAEPYVTVSPVTFGSIMSKREGFTLVDQGEPVGCVSFSDHEPLSNIIIHAFIRPDYRSRWLSRTILKQVHDFPFVDLNLPRVTGISIVGLTLHNDTLLTTCGFLHEGTMRQATRINGTLHDVRLYGLLREERLF